MCTSPTIFLSNQSQAAPTKNAPSMPEEAIPRHHYPSGRISRSDAAEERDNKLQFFAVLDPMRNGLDWETL